MKKLLGYVVGLGISASVIIGGIGAATNVTKTMVNNTKSSAVYEATGNAVNDTIYGVMGAMSGKGFNFSTIKDDISSIGLSILPTSNRSSKVANTSKIDTFKPSENPNYVEGFH